MNKVRLATGALMMAALGVTGGAWSTYHNWSEPKVMPVVGATSRDWHPDTFWYEPWGQSLVHKGMDIFAERGTPVVAATHHIILSVNDSARGGKNIWALGPNWRLHYYAHLDSIVEDLAGYIDAGTQLGTVGSSGNAQGKPPHLHYGIRLVFADRSRIDDATLGEQKAHWLNPIDYLAPAINM
ncbi:M23 family metallopeptidase [Marinomonas aquimarina]|nr:M23 family metallopeptidase [Marinomonas aquimarina]